MGTSIPAKCNKCGHIGYITNMVSIEGTFLGTTKFNINQKCQCGGVFTSLEGQFAINDGKADLVSGPDSSWEVLKKLSQVVKHSIEAGEAPERTVERAAEFLPWLQSGLKGKLAVAAFGVLSYFATKVADHVWDKFTKEPPVTIEQIEKAVRDAVQDAARADGLQLQQPDRDTPYKTRT